MPQKSVRNKLRRREVPSDIRFITFSCYRRLPLLSHPLIMDVFANALADARVQHGFELFAWVVMPEHTHILLRPAPQSCWAAIALSLKTSVAKRVLARWRVLQAPILDRLQTGAGRTRFWQHGGGFDRNVRNITEFTKAVKYIHHNPVKRKLVERPEAWRWSSVRWWVGNRTNELVCDPPPGKHDAWKNWNGYL